MDREKDIDELVAAAQDILPVLNKIWPAMGSREMLDRLRVAVDGVVRG
jgi:hypothetical protein